MPACTALGVKSSSTLAGRGVVVVFDGVPQPARPQLTTVAATRYKLADIVRRRRIGRSIHSGLSERGSLVSLRVSVYELLRGQCRLRASAMLILQTSVTVVRAASEDSTVMIDTWLR